jgi:hypothetical protein
MTDDIRLTREQAKQIFKAMNGITGCLKSLPTQPENLAVRYAVMSNLAVIQTTLAGAPRLNSN